MNTLLRASGIGTAGAVVFVLAVWNVANVASGSILVEQGDLDLAEVRLLGALVAAVVAGVLGTVVAFVLNGRPRADLRFLNISGVVLILTGAYAFSRASDITSGIWLNLMHLAVAAPIVDQLRRWLVNG
ncbi:MAG: DUF6069 family protein [Actinomycetota bacterium]